ncbi:MAG: hypothetical protein RL742_444, partial [Bacteroidota bacterium]
MKKMRVFGIVFKIFAEGKDKIVYRTRAR